MNALCFGGGGLVGTSKALGHMVGIDQVIREPNARTQLKRCFFDYMAEAGVPLRQLERRVDEVFKIIPSDVRRGEHDHLHRHFKVAVGISGGSLLASGAISGLPLVELVREAIGFQVTKYYFRPDYDEYARALRRLPGVPRRLGALLLRELGPQPELPRERIARFLPSLENVSRVAFELLGVFEEILPRGVFTGDGLERYVEELNARHGLFGTFQAVRRSGRWLFVISERFNSTRRMGTDDPDTTIYFGFPPHDDIPIARAIRASCSIPGVTTPLEYSDPARGKKYLMVDGAIGKTLGRRKILEHFPIDLAITVNPVVPFDGQLDNLLDILEQTYRKLLHSRLRAVESYLDEDVKRRTIHFESRPEEFFYNMFRIDKMRSGLFEGYYQTLLTCHENYDEVCDRLALGGLTLVPRAALHDILRTAEVVREREYLGPERRERAREQSRDRRTMARIARSREAAAGAADAVRTGTRRITSTLEGLPRLFRGKRQTMQAAPAPSGDDGGGGGNGTPHPDVVKART